MGSVFEELRRVGTGLRLVFLGLIVVVINAIAAVGVAVAFLQPGKDPASMVASLFRDHPTAVMALLGLGVLSNVLAIAGKVYCLSIPAATGATPIILMAVSCSVIGLALNVIGQMPDLGASAAEFTGTSPVFTIAGYLFFVRFLRRLAAYLGSTRLLTRAKQVQFASIALMVTYLIAAIGHSAGVLGIATIAVGLILALGGIALFGWYALLIFDLRKTTEAAADHLAETEITE
jgi:hypothetical protein